MIAPNLKILLIEDDTYVLDMLFRAVNSRGFQAYKVNKVEKAMEVFQAEEFDVVICDIELPQICGIELAKKMKARKPLTEIILITGYYDERYSDIIHSIYAFFQKPFELLNLFETLDEIRMEKYKNNTSTYHDRNLRQRY